jgi:hypothetical protein
MGWKIFFAMGWDGMGWDGIELDFSWDEFFLPSHPIPSGALVLTNVCFGRMFSLSML